MSAVGVAVACAVCGTPSGAPVYRHDGGASISSTATVVGAPTVVYACVVCAHVQTTPLEDVAALLRCGVQRAPRRRRDGRPVRAARRRAGVSRAAPGARRARQAGAPARRVRARLRLRQGHDVARDARGAGGPEGRGVRRERRLPRGLGSVHPARPAGDVRAAGELARRVRRRPVVLRAGARRRSARVPCRNPRAAEAGRTPARRPSRTCAAIPATSSSSTTSTTSCRRRCACC